MSKKFIPCLVIKDGKVIKNIKDETVINDNPVLYVKELSSHNPDAIVVFDKSTSDEEHDKALDVIKEICRASEVDVYGAGNVKRMEDVKKIIYAGCRKAMLNYSKQGNVELTKEVSDKFGPEKIIACVNSKEELEQANQKKELLDFAFCLDESAASFENDIKQVVVLPAKEAEASALEILSKENIAGIAGDFVTEKIETLYQFKKLCMDKGIIGDALQTDIKWEDLKINSEGHVTVVVQDYVTDEVLMVAYMNKEAYENTLRTGLMTYYSRSRNELWIKGETSGHFQHVKKLLIDCDRDTILAKVSQVGAACHTGNRSCFYTELASTEYIEKNPLKVFNSVLDVINDRKLHPKEGSYTNYLFDKGIDKILKKVGEENTEIVIAAKNPNANEIKYEISDYLYHLMVLMAQKGITWEDITEDLANR